MEYMRDKDRATLSLNQETHTNRDGDLGKTVRDGPPNFRWRGWSRLYPP